MKEYNKSSLKQVHCDDLYSGLARTAKFNTP